MTPNREVAIARPLDILATTDFLHVPTHGPFRNGRQGNDMVTMCWAAKGGSGTTTVVCTLALESSRPSLIVDLAGEVPAVLGSPAPDRPGVIDWLTSDGPASQLIDLVVDVDDTTALLPARLAADGASSTLDGVSPERWQQLVDWLDQWAARHVGDVWIDGGTGCPNTKLAELVTDRWLVTRSCYLSLIRAARSPVVPTGVVLVAQLGRSLGVRDIERSLGASVVATVSHDPKVARCVDAGLIASPPPMIIRRELRRAAA